MQPFLVLLATLGTVIAFLTQTFAGVPQGSSVSENNTAPQQHTDAQALVLRNAEGNIVVNGVSVGMPRETVEGLNPDFPKTGTDTHSETGQQLHKITYKGADFFFVATDLGSRVERISVNHTPEGIKLADPILNASNKYNAPIHAYKSSNGHTYAVYEANSALDLAWVFSYQDDKITEIIITSGLAKYHADAKAIRGGQ